MDNLKLVIVGSEEKYWDEFTTPLAKALISYIVSHYQKSLNSRITFISGGCPKGGIDIWAQEEFERQKVDYLIYKPRVNKWSGNGGYKHRNMMMAQDADIIIDIEPGQRNSGGYWTLNYGRSIGKKGEVIRI